MNLIDRLKNVAGQEFDNPKCRVRNPNITARESIEIGNYIISLENERKILLDGIQKIIEMDKERGPFTSQAITALARITLSRIDRD